MGIIRKVLTVVVAIAILIGVAFFAGALQLPSAGVEDIGDWGEVTDEKIEIIHTLNIQNPNPLGAQIGDATTLRILLQLNGIQIGEVQKSGLNIQQGNNSVAVTSELQQDRIAEFWSKFINQDETIHAKISPKIEINAGPGFAISSPSVQVSALTDERPVSDALQNMGDEMEGSYGKSVSTDDIAQDYRPASGFDIGPSATVKAEYTIESVDFEWGSVSPEETELIINMRVRNTGDTPLPGVPDGLVVNILLNEIEVFHTESEAISLENIDRDSVLRPDETRTYTLVATAENQNIEEWLTSYASQAEQSSVRGELEFQFNLGDTSISIPEGGAVAYECNFQTGIFVDGQSTSTTCGEDGTIEIGPTQIEQSDIEQDDSDESAKKSIDPVARAQANPTEVEQGVEVSLDASSSSDSDGEIQKFIWRTGGVNRIETGENAKHTFRIPGEKQVVLIVVDDDGNTDRDTVTISVDRPKVVDDDGGSEDENTPEPTDTPIPTSTPTPTPTPEPEPPNAVATADPPSGKAPLTVEFDGSGSSDPDGTIVEYRWEIDGPTPGGRGETITRRFRTQGEYTATLIVTDDNGLTDEAEVTVTVGSRFGSSERQSIDEIASLLPVDIPLNPAGSVVLLPIGLGAIIFKQKGKQDD
jgi:LEA14-like dessication related protein